MEHVSHMYAAAILLSSVSDFYCYLTVKSYCNLCIVSTILMFTHSKKTMSLSLHAYLWLEMMTSNY